MGNLNSVILNPVKSTVTAVTPDSAEGLDPSPRPREGASNDTTNDFATILQNSLVKNVAGKSGKPLPQHLDGQPLPESIQKGPNTELIGNLLTTRSLKSGLQVMVGGKAPSDAGIDAFAKSQGIDPLALEALMGKSSKHQPHAPTNGLIALAGADAAQTTPNDGVAPYYTSKSMGEGIKQQPKSPINHSTALAFAGAVETAMNTGVAEDDTSQPVGESTKKQSKTPNNHVIAPADTNLAATNIDTGIALDIDGKPIATWLSASAIAQLVSASPALESQGRQTIEVYLQKPMKFNSLDEKQLMARPPSAVLPATPRAEQLSDGIRSQPMNTQPQDPLSASRVEKLTLNLSASAPLGENRISLSASRQNLPVVKLEAINLAIKERLTGGKATTKDVISSGLGNLNVTASPVPVTVMSSAPATVVGESGFIAAPPTFDSRAEPSTAQTLPEQLEQQSLRKQNEQADMSRRLAEALGQRLSAQISRGAWRVEMDLHPKSLGRIEIQLEMKNGEIEAHFTAANAATRELLQESMPRLRDAFEQHGMESAYTGLGLGNQAQSDGKPTAHNSQHKSGVASKNEEAGPSKHIARIDKDGLDVLV